MANKKKEIKSVDSLLAGTERLLLLVMIGLLPPVLFLLIGWWGSLALGAEENIKFYVMGGLLAGILIDMRYLRRWVHKAYTLPVGWFVVFYLFYSICLLGFFMGMPVLNLVMGLIGGYYVGICLRYANKNKDEVERVAKRTAYFAAGVMALVCLTSWMIAYLEPTIAANVQGMLNLGQALSRERILVYSAVGGLGLVLIEYFITRAMVKFARFM
jgi:hypothetical protein